MSMDVTHTGGLQFEVKVRDHRFTMDTPEHIGGSNQAPTPTEMFCASLAACAGLYLADYCARAGLPHEGFTAGVDWEVGDKPKRIRTLSIKVEMPHPLPEARQKAVYRAAHQCLLHRTVGDVLDISLEIEYPGGE